MRLWFWIFGLDVLYWSDAHPVSNNYFHSCPTQHLIFGEKMNSDVEKHLSASVVSAIFILLVIDSLTPVHSNSINYNLISLNILFGAWEDTFPSYYVDKILALLFLRGLDSFTCVVLFHSTLPVKLASNYPDFLQNNNVIWPRSQLIFPVPPRPLNPQSSIPVSSLVF